MRTMTVGEVAQRLGGTLRAVDPAVVVTGFALDSRDVRPGDLFLAVRGARVDGHDYVDQALESGAVAAVVEREPVGAAIHVDDLVEALARFGASLRDDFTGPVVGITGSNGKTTTKEFSAAVLRTRGPVLKSAGNRNTEYTSPLAWAERKDDDWAAVIEMAMRGFDQIAHLARISRPTIGVVTCIGTAHIEMVGSRAGIMQAKSELLAALPESGTAVLWQEDDFLVDLTERSPAPVRTFGFSPDAECRVIGYRALGWNSCEILLSLAGERCSVRLPTLGRHQALNAAAAVLVADSAGVPFESAVAALADAELPPLRMEVRSVGGATVVVDTYNASPDSTVAAIGALAEVPASGRRLAVLGEMRELGDFSESGHRMVGRAVSASPLDQVLLTGGDTRFIDEEARMAGFPADRLRLQPQLDLDAVREFLSGLREGDVVLIKGSRALGLERALEPRS